MPETRETVGKGGREDNVGDSGTKGDTMNMWESREM